MSTERMLIRDSVLSAAQGRTDRDLFSSASASAIGQAVYTAVFCGPQTTPTAPVGGGHGLFSD